MSTQKHLGKDRIRRRAPEPAPSRQTSELPASALLSDESEPQRVFHVKPPASASNRDVQRAKENSCIVAGVLLDLIAELVAEGILDPEEWLKPSESLGRLLANGSSSP